MIVGQQLCESPIAVDRKRCEQKENINHVAELICLQDDQPGISKSTRQIARVQKYYFSPRQLARRLFIA